MRHRAKTDHGTTDRRCRKAVDKALAQRREAATSTARPSHAVEEDDATQEKRQALEHWLQRVPDDPGGLLRRKFLLEHQRRQQRRRQMADEALWLGFGGSR